MSLHLQRDLDKLKKEILVLGNMVETAINNSVIALNNRDVVLAEKVLADEPAVDAKEVSIEEECLKILALHQPVAVDLRFIVVILKVNNDLERMGDFAANVAKRAMYLAQHDPIQGVPEFVEVLPKIISTMIREALDALVKMDVVLAKKVMDMDDEVDEINRQMYIETQQMIMEDVSKTERAINLLSSSRYLERIADLCTNIAEDVIFMVDGTVVRHTS